MRWFPVSSSWVSFTSSVFLWICLWISRYFFTFSRFLCFTRVLQDLFTMEVTVKTLDSQTKTLQVPIEVSTVPLQSWTKASTQLITIINRRLVHCLSPPRFFLYNTFFHFFLFQTTVKEFKEKIAEDMVLRILFHWLLNYFLSVFERL